MYNCLQKERSSFLFRFLCLFMCAALVLIIIQKPARAQSAAPLSKLNLPAPGTLVSTSPSFNPAIVTGIKIYPDNPLQFDFIIDIGDDRIQGEALQQESQKLINYFMATLTVPEDEMWVNLSPYEKDRIIAEGLSQTEMGRDMLAQDYLLKQLSASLIYPEDDFGREFWDRVYEKVEAKYETTEIPINTFNKIWIVPDEAVVYVHNTHVFVVENHLKVMLEEDYLSLESNAGSTKHGLGNITKDDIEVVSGVSSEIIREVLLPEIEREINEGKNFANLRQIYNSMLLATWYKKNLKESLLGQVYTDKNKVIGIDLDDKEMKQNIYDRYVEAFEKGVYNYIKEEVDSVTQEIIPRKYFAGGLDAYRDSRGADRFTETTGEVPQGLASKATRTHAVAEMTGLPLRDEEAGAPDEEELLWELKMDQGYADERAPDTVYADTVLSSLPSQSQVLALGEGPKLMDIESILEQGHHVLATNFSAGHLREMQEEGARRGFTNLSVQRLDYRKDFGLGEGQFDAVISHSSVGMYTSLDELVEILIKIRAVLKKTPQSRLVFQVLSTDDPWYGTGEQVGEDRFVHTNPAVGRGHVRQYWREERLNLALAKAGFEAVNFIKYRAKRYRNNEEKAGLLTCVAGLADSGSSDSDRNPDQPRQSKAEHGGIDFNPNNLNLSEQGDKSQIQFSADNIQDLNPQSINGILPVIINISPLPSVLPLLGLNSLR